jgi:hypothetical protein
MTYIGRTQVEPGRSGEEAQTHVISGACGANITNKMLTPALEKRLKGGPLRLARSQIAAAVLAPTSRSCVAITPPDSHSMTRQLAGESWRNLVESVPVPIIRMA